VKLEPVLALSPFVLSATIFIGAVTAIGGSIIALAQIDVKRTLSYLVSAYMGMIFVAVGVGQTQAALLLVFTHAVSMALLITSIGGIIWNSITQNVTQLGGLWSRRPISGLAFLVGTLGMVAFPPFGSFWAILELISGLRHTHPWLVGVLLLVNALTAFGLTRVFCLLFGGEANPMAQRSPEVHWPMMLPMTVLLGFVLHVPLLLQAWNLLPSWVEINTDMALLLIWSTIFGGSMSAVVYLGNTIPKPVRFPLQSLQNLVSYDFYTPKLYRSSVVFGVDLISRLASWIDKYLVDGVVNLFGLVTLFSGQNLKYSTSGATQFYALTVLLGVVSLGFFLCFPFLSNMAFVFADNFIHPPVG
jgi:NAD(P)H-quinone oxidoreductase subunit 5